MKVHRIELDCYEVTEPDFGGTSITNVAYFSTKELAYQFAKDNNKSWPKDVKKIYKIIEFNICESLDDYEQIIDKVKTKLALSKLTDEEKKLLSLI